MSKVLLTILLLLGNAFFVASEFALIASRRTVIEPLVASSRRAAWALSAMSQIPLMIAGAQLGITICSLGLGAIAEPALAHLFEAPLHALGLPASAAHPIALVVALGIIVYLHTVVGEMVPKNIAIAGPERVVLWLGPPMLAFCTATKPLLLAMKWLARRTLRLWRIENRVERESYQNVVNRPVCGSKPLIPVPVVVLPSWWNVKSDWRKRPSWTIFCVHAPVALLTGPPDGG